MIFFSSLYGYSFSICRLSFLVYHLFVHICKVLRAISYVLVLFCPLFVSSQQGKSVHFDFNNKNSTDAVSGIKPKFYEVSWVRDRFGNPNSAVYLQGSPGSFINLGTDSVLKPQIGSISLWVNVEHGMNHGRGIESNPIFLTRANADEDFCEAIYLGYDYETKNLNANTTLSEEKQRTIYSTEPLSLREWHHLVITYNDRYLWFYLDSKLQGRIIKDFRTVFLKGDSVLLGNKNSVKNERYFNGSIDDIQIYHRVLTASEVTALYSAPNPNRFGIWLKNLAAVFAFSGFFFLVISFIQHRVKVLLEREKFKNELNNKLLEQEMKVFKAQMDPHFVFNSLNTILHFIITSENEKAEKYLTKFSKLLRLMLETSTLETISLKEEIDLIHKYLEIESLRFSDVFTPKIILNENVTPNEIFIPHMMIQPFVENALWHGLRGKLDEKHLKLEFKNYDADTLLIIIEDNGVGIKNITTTGKYKTKSLGLGFIRQRLELLGKIHNKTYFLKISDAHPTGTRVELTIPIIKNTKHAQRSNN